MAQNMSRCLNPCLVLEALKEVVDICVLQRLTRLLAPDFHEQMIGLDFISVNHRQIIEDLIDELAGDVNPATTRQRFDLGIIG